MVQSGGFEPPTFGATIRRSNQLSYDCIVPCSARFLGKLGGKCKRRNRDFPQLVKKTSPEPDSPCLIWLSVNNPARLTPAEDTPVLRQMGSSTRQIHETIGMIAMISNPDAGQESCLCLAGW